jgi:hypothetical protein
VETRDFLKGYADLHVHAGPSNIPRELDAAEMALAADKAGYRAIVLKDHQYCSAPLATVLQKHLPLQSDLKIFGGMAVNNSIGGLNAKAVDVAIGLGSKVIWMPTVSSENHIIKHSGHGFKFPKGKNSSVSEKPIVSIDENGRLIPAAEEVLEVIAQHPDVILATGHGTRREVNAFVVRAHELGIRRILINHPTYMIGSTMEDMKYWASLGAYMEHSSTVSVPTSKYYCLKIEDIVRNIREVGPEHSTIGSDYGQANNGSPLDGVAQFFELLLQNGITEKELLQMTQTNPSDLLGI